MLTLLTTLACLSCAQPQPADPADLVSQVSTDRLMQTLTEIPPSRSPRGGEDNQRALVATETYLLDHLKALGFEPEALPLSTGPTYPDAPEHWTNIAIEIPGTAELQPDQPTEVLVLSAHYDSVQGSPGADDDGTGVAAILEIARILKDHPQPRTIRLLLFNLEETGLVGSRHYCATILRDRIDSNQEHILGMVSLEMLGYFTDEPNSQGSPLRTLPDGTPAPTVGDFIAVVGMNTHQHFSGAFAEAMSRSEPDLSVRRADYFPIPIPDILRSDHAPFLALNVPAFMLTDTANFRNPNYHRPSDSIATIDQERFTMVVKAVLGAAIQIARDGLPPEQPIPPDEPLAPNDARPNAANAKP